MNYLKCFKYNPTQISMPSKILEYKYFLLEKELCVSIQARSLSAHLPCALLTDCKNARHELWSRFSNPLGLGLET